MISNRFSSSLLAWVTSLAAACCLVAAWWVPSSSAGAALGWTCIPLWIASLRNPHRPLRRAFVAGCLTYSAGFYWLFNTISQFGGFPLVASLAIFGLFVCGSAVQFLFLAFIWNHIPNCLAKCGLRTALSWLIAQQFWIRIFPWDFGHTQIGFLPMAQIADLGGVWLITFLMMWLCESFSLRKETSIIARILSLVCLASGIAYGLWRIDSFPEMYGPSLRTVLVQGNVSLEQKHNISYFSVNRERYLKISKSISQPDSLIIWPESTITDFIPAELQDVRFSKLLPFIGDGSAFLVGAVTYRSDRSLYNSAVMVRPDGSLPEPYNKIVLMPFGEYTPFGDLFPFIKEINATAGSFTPGKGPAVLDFQLSTGVPVKVSPLICYEDVTPPLARASTLKGAELLVNQTNDAWFGDTVAPLQHHMIATFRAIENRRFLLRSTNTGLTAVVDPIGRTLATLPTFSEGTIDMSVNLIGYRTIYTSVDVEGFWWLLSVVVLGWSLISLRGKHRSR